MLLPIILNASAREDGSLLEGYLNSDYNHPVRIYFVHRPNVDVTTFSTFVGTAVVATSYGF